MIKKLSQKTVGFTLIELMMALAVVAILSILAMPSYSDYVKRSRRTEAEANLFELAQFMEQQFVNQGTYTDAGGNAPTLPFGQSPKTGGAFYAITIKSISATGYVLEAKGINGTDDPCSPLSIDQSGTQLPATQGCWIH